MGCYFNSDVPFYYEEDKNGKLYRMPKLRHSENKKVVEKIIIQQGRQFQYFLEMLGYSIPMLLLKSFLIQIKQQTQPKLITQEIP